MTRSYLRSLLLGCLCLTFVFTLSHAANAQSVCTHNASSQEQIDSFIANAQPGQTLCIADGTYGPIDASGISGTASQPITIRAVNDGQVLIRGDYALTVKGSYLVIEGVNVEGTNGEWAVGSAGNNNILRRVVAWTTDDATDEIWPIVQGGSNNLLEDCAAFGTGRKTMGMSFSSSNHDNTIRRCWVRYERRPFCVPEESRCSPATGVELGYGNSSNTMENILVTWNITNPAREENWMGPLYMSWGANNTIYGALVYIPATADWAGGGLFGGQSGEAPRGPLTGARITDAIAIAHPAHPAAATAIPFGLTEVDNGIRGTDNVASNLIGVAQLPSYIDWLNHDLRELSTRAQAEAALGTSLWAAVPGLCYQVIGVNRTKVRRVS